MKLSEYYDMMAELADAATGTPPPILNPRATFRDFDFRDGKGKDGAATVYFLDGKPIYMRWYDWDLDENWMLEQIGKEIGGTVKFVEVLGGNGHYRATIEVTPNQQGTKPQ